MSLLYYVNPTSYSGMKEKYYRLNMQAFFMEHTNNYVLHCSMKLRRKGAAPLGSYDLSVELQYFAGTELKMEEDADI